MNSYGGVQGLIFRGILRSTHLQHWICAARTKWSKNCAAHESAPRCAQNREWLALPLALHSELGRGETHVFLFLGHRAGLRRKQRHAELEGIKTSTEQKTKLKNSSISKSYDRREFSIVLLKKTFIFLNFRCVKLLMILPPPFCKSSYKLFGEVHAP